MRRRQGQCQTADAVGSFPVALTTDRDLVRIEGNEVNAIECSHVTEPRRPFQAEDQIGGPTAPSKARGRDTCGWSLRTLG